MTTNLERNAKFYSDYSLFNYYKDYINCNDGVYQYLVSNFEIKLICKILEDNRFSKILLIGLGFGRELDAVLKVSPDINVDVIDFNAAFLNPAQKIYSSDKVKFFRVDLNVESLNDFPSENYDLVICMNTLEYISDLGFESFFKESNRVLRQGGNLFVRLYNSSFPFFFADRRHLNKRSVDMPMLYPRPFNLSKYLIEKSFDITQAIPQGFRINNRLFGLLYSDALASLIWSVESWVARICAPEYAKNVYIIGVKP